MGDFMQTLGTLGTDVMQGAEGIGGQLLQGAQSLLGPSGLEGALGGLFGGGSPVGPGTMAADAASAAMPAAAAVPDVGAAAAPATGLSASSLMAGPGVGSVSPMDLSDTSLVTNPVGSMTAGPGGLAAGMSSVPTSTPLAGVASPVGAPQITGINTGIAADAANLLPGAATASPQTGMNAFLSKLLANPKLLEGGALAGVELLNANKQMPEQKALQALATQQGGIAKNQGELAMAEQQGLLPAGATNMFQGMLNANLAAVRAKYAQMGMTGSTAEMEDLAAVRDQVMSSIFQEGQTMATQGFKNMSDATGVQSTLLQEILKTQLQQNTDLGNALATFAGAAAK